MPSGPFIAVNNKFCELKKIVKVVDFIKLFLLIYVFKMENYKPNILFLVAPIAAGFPLVLLYYYIIILLYRRKDFIFII